MIINSVLYKQGKRIREIAVPEIKEILKDSSAFVWLGLYEPDEKLMSDIQEQFGLHELAVEDAHRAHQRPKIESYGQEFFIVLHTAQIFDNKVFFGETHIFFGAQFIVTVRHGASQSYASVRARCEESPERMAKGLGFVLYAIMDFVVDNYLPIVTSYEDELIRIEDSIFGRLDRQETAERLYDLKRDLISLRKATMPVLEITTTLMKTKSSMIPEETHPYFYPHWNVVRTNFKIIKDYYHIYQMPESDINKLNKRIRKSVFYNFLILLKHRKWERVRQGIGLMQKSPVLWMRLLAAFFPATALLIQGFDAHKFWDDITISDLPANR